MYLTELLLFISCLLILVYWSIKNRHNYWKNRNVPYLKPKNLVLGNTSDLFLKNTPLVKYHAQIYNELAPHKYGGYFHFFKPVFVARDPDLIKNILIKDFQYFINRGSSFMDEKEPLTQNLFNLRGEKWKNLRIKISPAFSPGKQKIMYNLMKECAEELVKVAEEMMENNADLKIKELMSGFTTDIISSCVFGLQSNTLRNPDSIFRQMGRRVFETSTFRRISSFLSSIFPWLRRILNIKIMDPKVSEFFISLVQNTIEYRKKNDILRNDFLDFLIALKEDCNLINANENLKKIELTDDLLTAQCFVFFVAGYETSSGTLTFALYELARNQEVQEKLFQEIERVLEDYDGNFTYDSIQQMTYLSQVVDETLRLYPILPLLIRESCKNYHVPNSDLTIEKNTRIIIPVLGLHQDPQYYPNPLEFNPENFTNEAKLSRPQCVYLPFGEGPRICIGMRFGLTQVKIGLAMMVKNFRFNLSPKMNLPFNYKRYSLLTTVDGDMTLSCSKR